MGRLAFQQNLSRLIAFFAAAMLPLLISTEAEAKTALLVVGNTTLSANDSALKNRLNYYYTVSVRDDGDSADTSENLIVISASVDPALVGMKYKFTSKGVMVMKSALFDDMGMTAAGAFGMLSSQTMLKINDATHQMAAGFKLSSLVTLYGSGKTIGWGTPAASSSRIAVTATGSHVTVFGYDSGQPMVNFTAPGRRVGYYLISPSSLNANGWKLFDHAADWADGSGAPVGGGSTSAITWSSTSTITRYAAGCGDFSPTWTPDDQLYSSYGDCQGATGSLTPKRSMGYARIIGMPSDSLLFEDIDTGVPGTPDIDRTDSGSGLDATGSGKSGKKPSGMLHVSGRSYVWIRNITTFGTQSRLKYTDNFGLANATWSWASWTFTEFGYPVFVQYGMDYTGGGPYVYIVAHDDPSAYTAADRFVLMRVPIASILEQTAYEFFSGTASQPAWVSFANRASRTAIFSSKGRCLRNGMTYNGARGRYYWWQQIPPTKFDTDSRFFGGFGVYTAPHPWGPWIPVYYTEKWDVGPGERGEFPTKWMSSNGISSSGVLCLEFSGDDHFSVREGTIAAGY